MAMLINIKFIMKQFEIIIFCTIILSNCSSSSITGNKQYLEYAISFSQQKEFELAIHNYNIALKENPNSPIAYYGRGLAEYHLKQFDKAINDYLKALQLKSDYFEVYDDLGCLYADMKQYDKALYNINKSIKINPQYPKAYYDAGTIYFEQNKLDIAKSFFRNAIKYNPHYATAYNYLGCIYKEYKKYDLAIIEFNKAILIDKNLVSAIINLCGLLSYNNDIEHSLLYLERAIGSGFKDIDYLNNNSLFHNIRNNQKYNELLKRIK